MVLYCIILILLQSTILYSTHTIAGSYAGFDVDQPTSASGGKPKVAQILKETKGYKRLVFIGDGATDAEASPPAVSVVCIQIISIHTLQWLFNSFLQSVELWGEIPKLDNWCSI